MPNISLVIVTDGLKLDGLEKAIESAKSVIEERVIVYQGSDRNVFLRIQSMSDFSFMLTPKGNADPDRNFAYGLATKPWILALDDDEYLTSETVSFISMITLSSADVVWFNFKNLVDGVDIVDILGEDPHPRLWRNAQGLIVWPVQAHTYPQINSPKQIFTKKQIVHDRTFKQIEARHKDRGRAIDQQNLELEMRFINAVKQKLGKK
jgi:hypothetical protein